MKEDTENPGGFLLLKAQVSKAGTQAGCRNRLLCAQ